MSTKQNKTIVCRIPEELFSQGNLAVADEVFAPDFVGHRQLPPEWPQGVARVKQFVTHLRSAFPDFSYTIEDMMAEDDKVTVRMTASGTHQGIFMGIAATGKKATWPEIHICRLQDDFVVEHWIQSDQVGMLQQLGVISGN